MVRYSMVRYSTVRYSPIKYTTDQYITVQYSTLRHRIIDYSTIYYITTQFRAVRYRTAQNSIVPSFFYILFYASCGAMHTLNAFSVLCIYLIYHRDQPFNSFNSSSFISPYPISFIISRFIFQIAFWSQ